MYKEYKAIESELNVTIVLLLDVNIFYSINKRTNKDIVELIMQLS